MAKQVDQGFMNPGMRVMAILAQQSTEGIFHRPCDGGVHVGLHGGEMDDILSDKIIRNKQTFRVNMIQCQHPGFGAIRHPGHIGLAEIIQDWNSIMLKYWHIEIQILTLKSIGNHSLILHADYIIDTGLP